MVKEEAIKAAKKKASYMLTALGKQRGDVINIVELKDGAPRTTTTTQHHGGYPHWWWNGYYGYGHGQSVTTTGVNNAISNSSVAMPSGGGAAVGASGAEEDKDLGLKPIKLRYEVQAVFEIR